MSDIEERFGDQIYRPGEHTEEDLTESERTERREQIEKMFASGETNFDDNGEVA